MDFQVIWAAAALADLQEIVDYLSARDSAAAERIGSDILEHVITLQTFPHIGPVFPRGKPSKKREILCHGYRIFYQVNQEQGTWRSLEYGMARAKIRTSLLE